MKIVAKTFGESEKNILNMFQPGITFEYNDNQYKVTLSGKPTCKKGEPKTDIYIEAQDTMTAKRMEFKISFKKQNADFLENKTNAERAAQLFGDNWSNIISTATENLRTNFKERPLIYKTKFKRTEAGAITLGWKFELLNKQSGELSGDISLTHDQIVDVYAGKNLSIEKRDALVNGKLIPASGIANFILFEDAPINNVQDAVNALITIDDYVIQHPKVYFACKALNYRTFRQKYDGNRPLAVYVKWCVENGKLAHKLCFETPLVYGGHEAAKNLKDSLDQLNIKTTDDINDNNVKDTTIIYK